ncbi:MAG: hypothetical protein KF708_08705 [Pirellulales bacterium]|nr:hypothetical protein [Pirellulales bacterium]
MGLAWFAIVASTFSAAPAETLDPNEPVYTRQRSFVIPFRVERPEIAAQEASEVQLHVSSDRGVTWQRSARALPDAGRFNFEAPHDGEYWFFVRTMGTDGGLFPPTPPQAELRVVVDTLQPRLDLEAERGRSGQVEVRWLARDRNLNPDSLKIEFRVADSPDPWRAVSFPPDDRSIPRVSRGSTTWLPQGPARPLAIRAEITDEAGNVAVTQVRLDRIGTATANSTLDGEGVDQDVALQRRPGMISNTAQTWPAEELPLPPFARRDANTSSTPPSMSERFPSGRGAPATPVSQGGADAGVEEIAPGRGVEEIAPGELANNRPGPSTRVVNLPGEASPYDSDAIVEELPLGNPATPNTSRPVTTSRERASGPFDTLGAPSESAVPTPELAPGADQFGLELLPIGERPNIVNSRRFELEYEVDSIGPSGIGKVELWGTRDGGRTWSSYGVDIDKRSPLVVSVDEEGIYGFRIAVTSGSGLGGFAPRSGDLPEVWIGVDLTKPVARLAPIKPENADRAGELTIKWKAADVMLADHPIALFYSESTEGPWTPITSGIDNTGRYVWQLKNDLPMKVYIRLEVRDQAGNVQNSTTEEPISLDQMRPQGHIRTIRPVEESRSGS